MNRANTILKSMAPDEKKAAQEILKGSQLTDLFDDLDLGIWGKKIALVAIDFVQANILPKLQEANATIAFVVAGVLDAIEAALKK
jgi:hypothetical protein